MTTKQDLNQEYVGPYSLEQNGYVKYKNNIENGSSFFFQKTIRDLEGNTKYFINVSEFDFSDLKGYTGSTLRYSAKVRFYRKWQEFSTELGSMDNTTIKQMESFFEDVYISMNCDLDHHNN